jgi:hypothetical protein
MSGFASLTRAARAAAMLSALSVASIATPLATIAQNVTVIVDGQTMSFDQPPIVQAGRVFVPMRAIFERLGASVVYSNGQINATGRGKTISLTIGSTQATVNGQPTTLDVAPFVVSQRTLVPLRFVSESLGAIVNWNDSTSTVTIRSGGGGGGQPPQGRVSLSYQWPTGTISNHYPQLRFQVDRPVAADSLRVWLDGRDVTGGLTRTAPYYVVPAPFSLGMGTHRVRVTGRTQGGIPFDLAWTFYQSAY